MPNDIHFTLIGGMNECKKGLNYSLARKNEGEIVNVDIKLRFEQNLRQL